MSSVWAMGWLLAWAAGPWSLAQDLTWLLGWEGTSLMAHAPSHTCRDCPSLPSLGAPLVVTRRPHPHVRPLGGCPSRTVAPRRRCPEAWPGLPRSRPCPKPGAASCFSGTCACVAGAPQESGRQAAPITRAPTLGLGLAVGGTSGHAGGQTRSWRLAGAAENPRKPGRVASGWPSESWKSSLPVFPTKGLLSPPPQRMCLFREQCCFLFSRHSERGPHPRGPAGEALRETGPCRATWDDSPRASRGQEFGGARSMGGGGRPEQPWGLLESGSWGRGGCAESRPSGPDPAAPRAEPGLVYTGWVSREGQQGPGLPPGGSTSMQAGEAAPGSWVLSQVDAVLPAPQIKSSGSERLSPSGTQGSRPRVPAPRGRETGPDPAGKEGPRGSRPLGHVALRSDQ